MALNLEKITKLADKGKVKKLIKGLKSKDSSIVVSILDALGKVGGEDAVNAITSLLESPDKAIRSAALTAIGKCGTAASETRLKYYLSKETDPDMINVIRDAIKVYTDNHRA